MDRIALLGEFLSPGKPDLGVTGPDLGQLGPDPPHRLLLGEILLQKLRILGIVVLKIGHLGDLVLKRISSRERRELP